MASRDVLNFIRRKKLNNRLLEKLNIMLLSAESVLNDAEEKQIKNRAVREWLAKLKEAIYDADDLVDEINLEPKTGGFSAGNYRMFKAYDSWDTANRNISAAIFALLEAKHNYSQ